MPSEKTYKELSLGVYKLDSKSDSYDTELQVDKIKEIGGIEYQILKTEDNPSNGMQAMAVAPVKGGEADTSEVVIAYAGTNFDDGLDIHTDVQTVVLGNKDFLYDIKQVGNKSIPVPLPAANSQVSTAEKFAEEVKADYPGAEVTTTGHSLGEYLALYVSAENKWGNVGFNGPDPYDMLSPEAKQWAEDNSDMLFNYRNKSDVIGNFGGNGTGAEILIDMDTMEDIPKEELEDMVVTELLFEMDWKGMLDSHRIGEWEFDDEGNVKMDAAYDNTEASQVQSEKIWQGKMAALSLFANQLKASGGGLSSNELIFLNSAQTLLTVEYIVEFIGAAIESIVEIYKKAIDELEEMWEKNIVIAQSIGTSLSYGEILEALEAGGVTKYNVVFEPMAYYRGKIKEASEIGEGFKELASNIREGIDKLIETDEDLADQIGQGVMNG